METRVLIPAVLSLIPYPVDPLTKSQEKLTKSQKNALQSSKKTFEEEEEAEESSLSERTLSSGLFETSEICSSEKDETQSVKSGSGGSSTSTTDCFENYETERSSQNKKSKGKGTLNSFPSCSSDSSDDSDHLDSCTKSRKTNSTKGKSGESSARRGESTLKVAGNKPGRRHNLRSSTSYGNRVINNVQGDRNKKYNSGVRLCAKDFIEKGTKLGANDGEIRILFLNENPQPSPLPLDDIRMLFGCFDRVTEDPLDEDKEIRLCNWIRFLQPVNLNRNKNNEEIHSNSDSEDDPQTKSIHKSSNNQSRNIESFTRSNKRSDVGSLKEIRERVNLIARFVDGKPQFEFIQRVDPGTELLAYFDTQSINQISNSKSFSNPLIVPATRISSGSNLPQCYNLSSFDLLYASKHLTNLYSSSEGVKIKQEHYFTAADGPLDLSKSLLSTSKCGKLVELPPSIKTETPFESPTSQKGFSSSSPEISLQFDSLSKSHKNSSDNIFSISNVLQPVSLFQPYSSHPSKFSISSNSPGNLYANSNSLISPAGNGSHFLNNSSIKINSALATPNSLRSSSSLSGEVGGGGGGSPRGDEGVSSRQTSRLFPTETRQRSPTNIVQIRPILRTRGRERSLLPCEVCGKAFDRPSLLKRHMRTHTGEKPHICDVCTKGFSTSSSLNTHRRIHSGEKPHQCPICGKRFTASSNLYYHRMTHNKEKPHKCMLCGKSFPTPGDLKSHQYVHSGSWPYNCPICHRGFSKQTNLRNHLLLHSGKGDKPHNCHICGKKFALACNLRAHLRTHEEEPISSCNSCKRSFLTSLNMLVNGHCRSCLLNSTTKPLSTSSELRIENRHAAATTALGTRTSSPLPSSAKSLTVVPIPSHLSGLHQGFHHHHLSGVQTSALSVPSFFPNGINSSGGGGGSLGSIGTTTAVANPFLEQLFEWNYKFAKETAGNLSIMQQKLLESQMLAAQLMIGSSNTPAFGMGISELLRMRPQDFNSVGVDLNKFMQQ